MSYSIFINGIDRTGDVINQRISVDDEINDQVNICNLSLVDLSGLGIPVIEQEIVVTLDGEVIFGGYIMNVALSKKEQGTVKAVIQCVDYTHLFDRNLVHKSYENKTDKYIIEDIIATYCAGFNITSVNVVEHATINQISFNYIQPSQVMRKLCELTGYNWYIDYNKDIHYFPLTNEVTPFNIDSDNDDYIDLCISKDSTQLKNRVYVRGGTYLSDETFYETKGDSSKRKFVLPDKPHEVTIKVNDVEETIGIKNVDISGFDWYLNFQEKYIEQDTGGDILTDTDTLRVEYKYDIPVLIALEDTASIEANGVKEFAIFDKTIRTTTQARDRAQAELTDYANSIIEGTFSTYVTGFRSGQYININLTEYGIDGDYIVKKVNAQSIGGGNFRYDISIASVKTMGIIKFLIELLEADRNLVELDDDEVVDELFNLSDNLISDSLLDSLTIDSAGPYRTWCVDSLETTATRARWDLFQWE